MLDEESAGSRSSRSVEIRTHGRSAKVPKRVEYPRSAVSAFIDPSAADAEIKRYYDETPEDRIIEDEHKFMKELAPHLGLEPG